jgi:GNS1/SUR4 family
MVAHSPAVPVVAVLVYAAPNIVLGQWYFYRKQPWDWRRTMAAWILGLAMFSAAGFLRTAPQLFHNFTHYTIIENIARARGTRITLPLSVTRVCILS